MTGKTHVVIGANTAWIALLFAPIDYWIFLLAAIGGLAAQLPDIDNRHAMIHQWTRGLLKILMLHKVRHRSLFHSLLILPLIIFLSSFLFPIHHLAPAIFSLGYMSHPFIDGFNPQGCEYLFPWKKNLRLIPKFLCVDTGGWVDHMLFGLGCLGILAMALTYAGLIQIQVIY